MIWNLKIKKKLYLIKDSMTKIAIDHGMCDGAGCAECMDTCSMEIFTISEDEIILQKLG